MPLLSEIPIPSEEAKPLFASAQAREINPVEFCRALKEHGIDGVLAMFYVAKAFSLPLEEAKRVVIEEEYGSVDAWADAVVDSISELDRAED
jgi:hypothetical protein